MRIALPIIFLGSAAWLRVGGSVCCCAQIRAQLVYDQSGWRAVAGLCGQKLRRLERAILNHAMAVACVLQMQPTVLRVVLCHALSVARCLPPALTRPCTAQTRWKDHERRMKKANLVAGCRGRPSRGDKGASASFIGVTQIGCGAWAATTVDADEVLDVIGVIDKEDGATAAEPLYYGTCAALPHTRMLHMLPASSPSNMQSSPAAHAASLFSRSTGWAGRALPAAQLWQLQ